MKSMLTIGVLIDAWAGIVYVYNELWKFHLGAGRLVTLHEIMTDSW